MSVDEHKQRMKLDLPSDPPNLDQWNKKVLEFIASTFADIVESDRKPLLWGHKGEEVLESFLKQKERGMSLFWGGLSGREKEMLDNSKEKLSDDTELLLLLRQVYLSKNDREIEATKDEISADVEQVISGNETKESESENNTEQSKEKAPGEAPNNNDPAQEESALKDKENDSTASEKTKEPTEQKEYSESATSPEKNKKTETSEKEKKKEEAVKLATENNDKASDDKNTKKSIWESVDENDPTIVQVLRGVGKDEGLDVFEGWIAGRLLSLNEEEMVKKQELLFTFMEGVRIAISGNDFLGNDQVKAVFASKDKIRNLGGDFPLASELKQLVNEVEIKYLSALIYHSVNSNAMDASMLFAWRTVEEGMEKMNKDPSYTPPVYFDKSMLGRLQNFVKNNGENPNFAVVQRIISLLETSETPERPNPLEDEDQFDEGNGKPEEQKEDDKLSTDSNPKEDESREGQEESVDAAISTFKERYGKLDDPLEKDIKQPAYNKISQDFIVTFWKEYLQALQKVASDNEKKKKVHNKYKNKFTELFSPDEKDDTINTNTAIVLQETWDYFQKNHDTNNTYGRNIPARTHGALYGRQGKAELDKLRLARDPSTFAKVMGGIGKGVLATVAFVPKITVRFLKFVKNRYIDQGYTGMIGKKRRQEEERLLQRQLDDTQTLSAIIDEQRLKITEEDPSPEDVITFLESQQTNLQTLAGTFASCPGQFRLSPDASLIGAYQNEKKFIHDVKDLVEDPSYSKANDAWIKQNGGDKRKNVLKDTLTKLFSVDTFLFAEERKRLAHAMVKSQKHPITEVYALTEGKGTGDICVENSKGKQYVIIKNNEQGGRDKDKMIVELLLLVHGQDDIIPYIQGMFSNEEISQLSLNDEGLIVGNNGCVLSNFLQTLLERINISERELLDHLKDEHTKRTTATDEEKARYLQMFQSLTDCNLFENKLGDIMVSYQAGKKKKYKKLITKKGLYGRSADGVIASLKMPDQKENNTSF